MKNKLSVLVALVVGLGGVSIVAQDAPRPGGERPPGRERGPDGPGGPEGARFRMPLMAALDANNDGTIDEKEIEQASKALKTLDKNNDGKINPEELRPARPDRPGEPGRTEGRRDRPPGQP